jgi:hypothetical protein
MREKPPALPQKACGTDALPEGEGSQRDEGDEASLGLLAANPTPGQKRN